MGERENFYFMRECNQAKINLMNNKILKYMYRLEKLLSLIQGNAVRINIKACINVT